MEHFAVSGVNNGTVWHQEYMHHEDPRLAAQSFYHHKTKKHASIVDPDGADMAGRLKFNVAGPGGTARVFVRKVNGEVPNAAHCS